MMRFGAAWRCAGSSDVSSVCDFPLGSPNALGGIQRRHFFTHIHAARPKCTPDQNARRMREMRGKSTRSRFLEEFAGRRFAGCLVNRVAVESN